MNYSANTWITADYNGGLNVHEKGGWDGQAKRTTYIPKGGFVIGQDVADSQGNVTREETFFTAASK